MIIRISDTSLTTTLGIGTNVANNHGFYDEYSTTVSCLTSTMSTQPTNENYIYINSANNYINSLSNEQIIQLEKELERKESEIITAGGKSFTLEQLTLSEDTKTQKQVKTKVYKKI